MTEKDIEERIKIGEVDWYWISRYQKLSEPFIDAHKSEVNWYWISRCQKLSESFIDAHKLEVDWYWISCYQKLSEPFIDAHKLEVDWYWISRCQKLSEPFIDAHKSEVDCKLQKRKHMDKRSIAEKKDEMKTYADKYGLIFDGNTLYAFREHDSWGRGAFNKTIAYDKGYYRDWHCDLDHDEGNSFGMGIFPKGNVKVAVTADDWGVAVKGTDGKARVWGFTLTI